VHNRLAQLLDDDLTVCYLRPAATVARGWGGVRIEHRHFSAAGASGRTSLRRTLMSPQLRAVCLYGYRGAARLAAANVARLRGIPLILRGDANVRMELSRPRLRRVAKRLFLPLAVGQPEVWTNGVANTAYWHEVGLRRMYPIPGALLQVPGGAERAGDFLGRGWDNRFVFAYVGRLEADKGVEDLLAAYDTVRSMTSGHSTALLIAGVGSQRPVVAAYAQEHEDCRYVGGVEQDQLGGVYAASDVVVMPSHFDSWGWVVNEALGLGARVIASDEVASADDLVTPERGRRCPARDPAALAAAMLAEYERGRGRIPPLECVDIAALMAERLAELTGAALTPTADVATG
jgi:glycosyltransferase involved in cell wall biosynthesis